VTGMSFVLLAAIIATPILLHSNGGTGPSSTPAVPIVTTPTTNGFTTREQPFTQPIDTSLDKGRYGLRLNDPTAVTSPPATSPPATSPPATSPPATPAPAATPQTLPPQTAPPPTSPPPTSPPLTIPQDGPIITP
jgi:hypothetical protein